MTTWKSNKASVHNGLNLECDDLLWKIRIIDKILATIKNDGITIPGKYFLASNKPSILHKPQHIIKDIKMKKSAFSIVDMLFLFAEETEITVIAPKQTMNAHKDKE